MSPIRRDKIILNDHSYVGRNTSHEWDLTSRRMHALGSSSGVNAIEPGPSAWIGPQGPYTVAFVNKAPETVILVLWGPGGSWINAHRPLVTYPLPPDASVTISFPDGSSGGWAGVYADTVAVNGQIFNTWGEFTFARSDTTYDVSRLVNMQGHSMSIRGPQCTSDMNTCVYVCSDRTAKSCWFDYELINCDARDGGGTGQDPSTGDPAGGCHGVAGAAGDLIASFS